MLERPIEYALIEFKGNKFSGDIAPELLDLAERGIVRYIDIVFIEKDKDGTTRTIELNDFDPKGYEMFVPLGKHVQSLFTTNDLEIAASKLKKNTSAALFLWENLWLDGLRESILKARGSLVERGQISPEVVKQFNKELAAHEKKQAAKAKRKATAKSAASGKGAAKKSAKK